MWYAGIDQHKHYSQVCVMREDDTIVSETRVSHANNGAAITALFDQLPEPCEVVFEAGYNWMWLYDVLEPLRMISGIHLANPLHVRIIAAAEIKTDKLDARKPAMLLRARLIPEVHIPGPATRARKLVLRQRMFLVRERTRLRNRIHKLLARQQFVDSHFTLVAASALCPDPATSEIADRHPAWDAGNEPVVERPRVGGHV